MDQDWRSERALAVADAMDLLFEDLEALYSTEDEGPPTNFLHTTTGLPALDRVCDGGLWPGTITVLDAALDAQARALLYTVARLIEVRCLLAVGSTVGAVRWLLSNATDVPEGLIHRGTLSKSDWASIHRHIGELTTRDIFITEAESMCGIRSLLKERGCPILLVDEPERFGPQTRVLMQLAEFADRNGVAILTTARNQPGPIHWEAENVTRVSVVPHSLGSRAALVTTGGWRGLSAAQVSIDLLTGQASEVLSA